MSDVASPRTSPPETGHGGQRSVAALAARAWRNLVSVLPQWLVARAIVLGALALAHLIVSRTHITNAGVVYRVHTGLLGWDAGFYETIARVGYGPNFHQTIRFFPLVPLSTRALAYLPGIGDGVALLFVANACSLVATALLAVLARRETGDQALARRAVWLICLAPPAFVFVMGYAESTLLLFSVACFLAIRPRLGQEPRWCWAAVFGLGAALTRPLGVLLMIPIIIEGVRWWRASQPAQRLTLAVAGVAPLAGLIIFLAWARAATGDFLLPLRVQSEAGHHGGLSDPFSTLAHDARGVLHHHFGTALHVPWVVLVLALLVVCWRSWPASYAGFATAVVVVAISGTNLDSFERYALSAFPLALVGATLTRSPTVERCVLTLAAAGLAGYALLAFLNISVP
jgi:Mannosyltransferase (PIG-V)